MKEADTIRFLDASDSDETVAIVRYDEKSVAVCLSKKSNGDIEVVMSKTDAKALLEALQKAIT